MTELVHQAESAQLAAQEINNALCGQSSSSTAGAFAAAQSLLAAGAMVSKLLWPQAPPSDGSVEGDAARQRTTERGRHLRKELKIKGIPVLESRKVRNSMEHFDDRLDSYLASEAQYVLDRVVATEGQINFMGQAPTYLRRIDPDRMTISVLAQEVSMQELLDAMDDVAQRASRWIVEDREQSLGV